MKMVNVAELISIIRHWFWLVGRPVIKLLEDEDFIQQLFKTVNSQAVHILNTDAAQLVIDRQVSVDESRRGCIYKAVGVSQKKQHEISLISHTINYYCQRHNCRYIVDIGCGLGHLAKHLSAEYDYHVLGIECDSQLYHHLEKHSDYTECSHQPKIGFVQLRINDTEECLEELQKIVMAFAVSDHEGLYDKTPSVMLLSLHCCGDLRTSLLRLFRNSNLFAICLLVGCCYHKMSVDSEGFATNFPLSMSVKNVMMSESDGLLSNTGHQRLLNINCLRLGAEQTQEMWQARSEDAKLLHLNLLFFRAIVECLKTRGIIFIKSLRKPTKLSDAVDFETYVTAFLDRNTVEGCSIHECKAILCELHRKMMPLYESFRHLIDVQMVLQAVVESLILLDAIEFLHESSDIEAIVRPMFNAAVSPRNLAIIADKRSALDSSD